jgi:hypothetical protein
MHRGKLDSSEQIEYSFVVASEDFLVIVPSFIKYLADRMGSELQVRKCITSRLNSGCT